MWIDIISPTQLQDWKAGKLLYNYQTISKKSFITPEELKTFEWDKLYENEAYVAYSQFDEHINIDEENYQEFTLRQTITPLGEIIILLIVHPILEHF